MCGGDGGGLHNAPAAGLTFTADIPLVGPEAATSNLRGSGPQAVNTIRVLMSDTHTHTHTQTAHRQTFGFHQTNRCFLINDFLTHTTPHRHSERNFPQLIDVFNLSATFSLVLLCNIYFPIHAREVLCLPY